MLFQPYNVWIVKKYSAVYSMLFCYSDSTTAVS